jgi:hypothetical protein
MTLFKSRPIATALVLAISIGGGLLDTGPAHPARRITLKGSSSWHRVRSPTPTAPRPVLTDGRLVLVGPPSAP